MTLTDARYAAAWQAQSVLLGYPDQDTECLRPTLRRVADAQPAAIGAPLHRFLDHLDATAPLELAADYVATFDHRKRCGLYLTYYAYGDTRKRGMALLRFKHAYRRAGLVLGEDELPDHLAVVLEFAATGDADAGQRLLSEHRAGLELLRLSLHDQGSPWADVLDSVSATLPPVAGREHDAIARLAAQGPPEEQVGLAPYAPLVPDEFLPPTAESRPASLGVPR